MLDFLSSPYFLLFARLCVGGVFLASALGKWLDKPGTEASLSRYPFLPAGSGLLVANLFPPLELLVGGLLVMGLFTRFAAVAAVALFVLFTGLILYDLTHGKTESCHCFGRLSEEKLTPMAVVRNAVLMVLALLVAFLFDGWMAVDTALSASIDGGLGLIAREPGAALLPTFVDAIPVALLALATVAVAVLGGQFVSTVRTTLRSIGPR